MLAPPRAGSYFPLMFAAAACVRPAVVAPAGAFVPAGRDALAAAERANGPRGHELTRLTWRFDDGRIQLAGNGSVRTAAPDSLRADIGAALGLGRATVIATGDAIVAEPEHLVDQLVPDRFALWTVLGYLRAPTDGQTIEKSETGTRTAWRLTDRQGRVTLFDLTGGRLVMVTRETGGRTLTQLQLTRDPGTGAVQRARLTDYGRSTRLDVAIVRRESSEPFPPEVWRLRR